MNLDLQVEGSRIASELDHLRQTIQTESTQNSVNRLFLLAIKGFALSIGIICSLICALCFKVEIAFISITSISFTTFGLVIGGRKIATIMAPLENRLFSHKRNHLRNDQTM